MSAERRGPWALCADLTKLTDFSTAPSTSISSTAYWEGSSSGSKPPVIALGYRDVAVRGAASHVAASVMVTGVTLMVFAAPSSGVQDGVTDSPTVPESPGGRVTSKSMTKPKRRSSAGCR